MSFFHRFSQEASNAFQDMYGSVCLGDDAGKSARLTLVLKPHSNPASSKAAKLNLGMTFVEINGRAYVASVLPGSQASRAGVMPQDAIQFATVFKSEWMDEDHENHHHNNNNNQQQQDEGSLMDASEIAIQNALRAEAAGVRITYDGLRKVLAEAIDPTQSAFVSPSSSKDKTTKTTTTSWHHGPPIPSTVNICVNQSDADGFMYNDDNGVGPASTFLRDLPRPVVFVFRRTRQRKSSSAAISMLLPSFRLDDECDFASSLVKRLAPTADMEMPTPDTWEELVHDGTDWLLGSGSMMPPKMKALHNNNSMKNGGGGGGLGGASIGEEGEHSIPLDSFERERATKLADLRSKMAAEAMQVDRTDDVEAATIRGMIQKAVGLAFVRASKVVLGVSVHGGSGIVISRLSDGTWSAPSAIGTWGLGLGLQFGLEVAEYIFILQTQDSLDHFRSGGSFTIGGNIGAAVAGMGREAYGAASAGGSCGAGSVIKDDEYNDNDSNENNKESKVGIAPIVAYAKSQGLYIGVSLEGSRIFARNDINSRTYKFTCGRDVSAYDILSGKVPTPPEAEDLYAALHCVEFTHEMSCLPRPPEVLRKDSPNAWFYDRSTLGDGPPSKQDPFNFLSTLTRKDEEACETFETQFKKFMYGGVSVQRLLPNTESRSGRTGRERRTLWLMLPEVGSLRLGFVSKLSDGESAVSNKSSTLRARRDDSSKISMMEGDLVTVESEEVTLDSALYTEKDGGSTIGQIRTGNVQLSNKHSVALTDLTLLSHDPLVPIKFNPDDKTEHLRVISLQDVSGTSLLFLANNFREAELLMCGLKLLLERETARLGVRGGLPISALGGRVLDGAMSPTAARGFRDHPPSNASVGSKSRTRSISSGRRGRSLSGYASSDVEEFDSGGSGGEDGSRNPSNYLPEGRKSWGRVPGRSYMRGQAASSKGHQNSGDTEQGVPQYVHGQLLVRDIAKKVRLPLPLPLCRVLLLDSTSPVIARWEKDRGDASFDHTLWTFPPATPRELERHASEHSLIATGSMCGAHRTSAFNRMRNGSWVRLSETQIVDADDSEKLAITVSERMPRRGFSIKIRILLRAVKDNACDATVFTEIRPVGKDMSNQAAVHRAFSLVINEIASRYGEHPGGLMAGFLSVIETMGQTEMEHAENGRTMPSIHASNEEKKSDTPNSKQRKGNNKNSGLVSFEDMLKTGRQSPELINTERPSTPSLHHEIPEPDPSKRLSAKSKSAPHMNEFMPVPELEDDPMVPKEPVLIEVKPLPKIRLSLMPSPREEDEDNDSSYSPVQHKQRKKKSSSSKRKPRGSHSSSWRKSGKYKNKA